MRNLLFVHVGVDFPGIFPAFDQDGRSSSSSSPSPLDSDNIRSGAVPVVGGFLALFVSVVGVIVVVVIVVGDRAALTAARRQRFFILFDLTTFASSQK